MPWLARRLALGLPLWVMCAILIAASLLGGFLFWQDLRAASNTGDE
jgi:hypothetical protein